MKFKSLLLVVGFIPAIVMAQANVIALPAGSEVGGVKPGVPLLVVKPTPVQPKLAAEPVGLQKGLPPQNPITAVGYGASSVSPPNAPPDVSATWSDPDSVVKPQ